MSKKTVSMLLTVFALSICLAFHAGNAAAVELPDILEADDLTDDSEDLLLADEEVFDEVQEEELLPVEEPGEEDPGTRIVQDEAEEWIEDTASEELLIEDAEELEQEIVELAAEEQEKITIYWDAGEGRISGGSVYEQELTVGRLLTSVPKSEPTPTGRDRDTKIFSHWSMSKENDEPLVWTEDADGQNGHYDVELYDGITFYAVWGEVVKLTLDANGGEIKDWNWIEDDDKVYSSTRRLNKGSFVNPYTYYNYKNSTSYLSCPGMAFVGWTTVKDDASTLVSDGLYVNEDMTLYALWTSGYDITFELNGGALENALGQSSYTEVYQEGDIIDNNPKYPLEAPWGMMFIGWTTVKDDADTLISDTSENAYVVLGNAVLYALWRDGSTVEFDGNGYELNYLDKIVSYVEISILKGSVLDFAPEVLAGDAVFLGWSTSTDAKDIIQIGGEDGFKPDTHTTLYAIVEKHIHTMVKTEAVDAACMSPGNIEYYTCSGCGKIFSDAEGTTEITLESTIVPALGHDWDNGSITKAASCTEPGVKTYTCRHDSSHTRTEEIASIGHNLEKVAKKEATTDSEGNIEYYICSICKKLFSDKDGTTEITLADTRIPRLTKPEETKTSETPATDPSKAEEGAGTGTGSADTSKTEPAQPAKTEDTGSGDTSKTQPSQTIKTQEPDTGKGTLAVTEKPSNPEGDVSDKSSVAAADKAITKMKDTAEPKGSSFAAIQVKSTKQTSTSITVSWNKVKGASGYIIYGNKVGKKYPFQRLSKQKKNSFTYKKLAKGTYYKFSVVAYKTVKGKEQVIASAKTIYASTKGGKYTNLSKVKLNASKKTLKKGATFKLKVTKVKQSAKLKLVETRKIRFESSNTKIATVDKNGKIKAKKKGSCIIYAFGHNGVYAKIKISVK